MTGRVRTAVLVSGRGSNMMSLIEASRRPGYPADIVLVASNRPDAGGLQHARAEGIEVVERAWAGLGGTYLDLKIECGVDGDGALVVADVIDSDSGRLRFGDRDVSKQSYRDASLPLPAIKRNFDEVAELTKQFV